LLVLNKPSGITSRRALDEVQRWFPRVRLGHAGTLDPLATGVLVVCLGQATRFVEYIQRMPKTYRAIIRLGGVSTTDDADGEIELIANPPRPSAAEIDFALAGFIGEIEQVPPAFSAAHVEGRRAHKLARRGEQVELQPRRVRIDRIVVLRYEYPELEVAIDCGKGTYIRSIARDLGQRLGCGGYVGKLERLRIGPFRIEDAVPLTAAAEEARVRVLPATAALAELPRVSLNAEQARRLRLGQRLPWPGPVETSEQEVLAVDELGRVLAIAGWSERTRVLAPHKVLMEEGG
jgi:tRNA pseudouridine55 synthase